MLKWIGRILYVVFVLLVIGFVEFTAGGIVGMQRSEYARVNIIDRADNDEDYTVFDGLDYFNAAIGTYYSNVSIKNTNDENHYDTTAESIDNLYKIKLGIYPFISTLKDPNVDIWYDGFYIVVEDYHEDVLFYSFDIIATHVNDPENKKITLTKDPSGERDDRFLYIYPTTDGFIRNERVPLTTYLYNTMFYNADQNELGGIFEYNIISISVFAHVETETDPVFIYRMTDGSENYVGSPLVLHETLNLTASTFNISKQLENLAPTQNDIDTFNIVTTYHPADFSPYNHFYYIVYSIYFLLVIVVPYFWFFHKKVMTKINKNKPQKETEEIIINQPKEQQLFSDEEPKSDK